MNVVLYTKDFEPITVLDLPLWLTEEMEKRGGVKLAVQEPLTSEWLNSDPSVLHQPKVCTLYCQKLKWFDGTQKTIVITPDEELALILKPDWLPGQRAVHNQYVQRVRFLTSKLIEVMRRGDPG